MILVKSNVAIFVTLITLGLFVYIRYMKSKVKKYVLRNENISRYFKN